MRPSFDWLTQANERYADRGMLPDQRPWEAWREYALHSGLPLDLTSETTQYIFDWFRENAGAIGHVRDFFVAAYFYDATFWALPIPVVFGTQAIDLTAPTRAMSRSAQARLASRVVDQRHYLTACADTIDLALGLDALKVPTQPFAQNILTSARQHFEAATVLVLASQPASRAVEACALTVETFLKGFLAVRAGLDERGAVRIRHNLTKALAQSANALDHRGASRAAVELRAFEPDLRAFPPFVSERYQGTAWVGAQLWHFYRTALAIGAFVTRQLGGPDSREDISQGLQEHS
jgi:hypothetical protein